MLFISTHLINAVKNFDSIILIYIIFFVVEDFSNRSKHCQGSSSNNEKRSVCEIS